MQGMHASCLCRATCLILVHACNVHAGLEPSTVYFYRVGDPAIIWSQELNHAASGHATFPPGRVCRPGESPAQRLSYGHMPQS
jgi:hypothetical protein